MIQQIVIETQDLSIGYNLKKHQQKILHTSLNLRLYSGEVTCLLGLNGAGKSTLLRTLCGFQPAISGTIKIMNKSISDYSTSQFSLTVGVVLTEKTNVGGLTVYELVSLGRHPYTGFFGQLKKQDKTIIEKSIKAVGIEHKAFNYVSELSDGERQKAMIAKTLAQECPIIILDEPTAFLDATSRIETMVLLHKLAVEQNKAILLSSHDLDLSIQMGDKLWLLKKGQPMFCDSPEDLILSGKFAHFFEKEGITFNPNNGKLSFEGNFIPVKIKGDPQTVYWARNALLRNGYKPIDTERYFIFIHCIQPNNILVYSNNETIKKVSNISEMILYIHTLTAK